MTKYSSSFKNCSLIFARSHSRHVLAVHSGYPSLKIKFNFRRVFFLLFLTWAQLSSAETSVTEEKSGLEIVSDNLVIDQKNNQAVFTGNPVLTQPDLKLTSDKLVVEYEKTSNDMTPSDSKMKTIRAFGRVKIVTPEQISTGEDGFYDLAANSIILKEKVELIRDGIKVRGDYLVHDVKANRSEIHSDKNNKLEERANVKIYQQKKEQ